MFYCNHWLLNQPKSQLSVQASAPTIRPYSPDDAQKNTSRHAKCARIAAHPAYSPDNGAGELLESNGDSRHSSVFTGHSAFYPCRIFFGRKKLLLMGTLTVTCRMFDDDRARLGRGQPARHHRRIIGRAGRHPVAGPHAIVLDQRVRDPVGPVGELFIRSGAGRCRSTRCGRRSLCGPWRRSVPRRRSESRGSEAVQQQVRPLLRRRQTVARERVEVSGRSERAVRRGARHISVRQRSWKSSKPARRSGWPPLSGRGNG